MQAPQRTTVRGPTFIRLLARLTDVDAPQSNPSLADRLSQWLDWTHAIALSTALDGAPPGDAPASGGDEEDECARVRATLTQAIANAPELAASSADAADEAIDYDLFRKRYLALQRSMQAATGRLRGRLRDQLGAQPGAHARLAAVDAVMELALSPREQALLAAIPTLLGTHFERLRRSAPDDAAGSPGVWLDGFRQDVRQVLLAELDVRFQPVEGLLAALRTR